MVGKHDARLLCHPLPLPRPDDGAFPISDLPVKLGLYGASASSFHPPGMFGLHKHGRPSGTLHPHLAPAQLGPCKAALLFPEASASQTHLLMFSRSAAWLNLLCWLCAQHFPRFAAAAPMSVRDNVGASCRPSSKVNLSNLPRCHRCADTSISACRRAVEHVEQTRTLLNPSPI